MGRKINKAKKKTVSGMMTLGRWTMRHDQTIIALIVLNMILSLICTVGVMICLR